jgi:hypothetical protein
LLLWIWSRGSAWNVVVEAACCAFCSPLLARVDNVGTCDVCCCGEIFEVERSRGFDCLFELTCDC